jgi:hypothetical protein
VIVLLVLFGGIILAERGSLARNGLSNDICGYAVIGHEMMRGRELYSDLWERKPPLLYATFSAAELVTGYDRNEIFWLGTGTALLSLVLIYTAAAGGEAGAAAGLFAAGLWVVLNCDLDLTGNQPDPETFINAWMTAAVCLLLRWRRAGSQRLNLRAVFLGALLSAATLYKHNIALVCLALLIGHAVISDSRKMIPRLIESFIAGCVMLGVWGAVLGYFATTHRLGALLDVLLHQNLSYTGNIAGNLMGAFGIGRFFPPFMVWAIGPIALCAMLGIFGLRNRRLFLSPSRDWLVLLAWAVGTFLSIAVIGYRYSHYYQLWLPICCIAGGWACAGLTGKPRRVAPVVGYAAIVVCFAFLVFRQASEFALTPRQWAKRQFGYCDLLAENQLAIDLGHALKSDEQFWELGEDNCLYFISGHSPPTGLLFIDPYVFGDETKAYTARLLNDLDRSKPSLVVLSDDWNFLIPGDSAIFPWLKQNYVVWETPLGFPHYRLLVRRGSALQRRATSTTAS